MMMHDANKAITVHSALHLGDKRYRTHTHLTEVEEVGDEAPDLILLHDQLGVEVQVIRRNDLRRRAIRPGERTRQYERIRQPETLAAT
jgi:hypothetical protein